MVKNSMNKLKLHTCRYRNILVAVSLMAILTHIGFSDVTSISGNINFHTLEDQPAKMILNATGLGIGVSPSSRLHVQGNAMVSNQISIGGSSGSSNFHINGTTAFSSDPISIDSNLSDHSQFLADSSAGNLRLTLPYAGNAQGRVIQVKKISKLNTVWVYGGGNL